MRIPRHTPTTQPGAVACPAGQVVSAVDFGKRTLTCVPLPTTNSESDALRVVDNDGQLAGMVIDVNLMARQLGNNWYYFRGLQTGFEETGVSLLYELPIARGLVS
jgi:hypothetical protein